MTNDTRPITHPAAAIFSENSDASKILLHNGSPLRPTAGSKSLDPISHRCGIAPSPVLGVIARSPTTTPLPGLKDL